MEFEAIIGLELHVEMKTKSKMFSSSPVSFGEEPNSQVTAFDMAFPGSMPTVNKEAVINAIRVCNALHMHIEDTLVFDRKNYFYSDLPKGYQITQYERPIGSKGYLDIDNKRIGLERLHIEEDTCKQLHLEDCTLLNYNRSGIPLLEIVTLPDIKNGEEAMKLVEKIRSIVTFLDVSDGKMEEGSLRCDVNISLRDKTSGKLGSKVEIKNLNSISNVQKAIDYEIERQSKLLKEGKEVVQDTRRFDEVAKKTVSMRIKDNSIDYKYIREPNIPPIRLSKEFINQAIETSPELPDDKYERYLSMGLSKHDASLLVQNKDVSNYFDEAIETKVSNKLLVNWIFGDIQSILNKENISIKQFIVSPKHLAELVLMIEKGTISNNQGRVIFQEMLKNDASPRELIKLMGLEIISDENRIKKLVVETIENNPQSVIDYKNGKDRALSYLVGETIKKSQGRANPSLTKQLMQEELRRR